MDIVVVPESVLQLATARNLSSLGFIGARSNSGTTAGTLAAVVNRMLVQQPLCNFTHEFQEELRPLLIRGVVDALLANRNILEAA